MQVSLTDLAHLSDAEVARLVLSIDQAIDRVTYPPMVEFWSELSHALIRARRERRRAFATIALELDPDDGEMGALVDGDSLTEEPET